MADQPKILVLGDYATDIYLYAEKWREQSLYIREAPRGNYPFDLVRVPGGAGALVAYLERCGQPVKVPDKEAPCYHGQEDRLEHFYILSKRDEENRTAWRVDEQKGALPGGDGRRESTQFDPNDFKYCHGVIVMDFDGGWRKENVDKKNAHKLMQGINNKPYLIRSHDPLEEEWVNFRTKMENRITARPGLWVGVAEDLDEGALRKPGIWEDYRDRISAYLEGDSSLYESHAGWKHFVIIRIDYDGVLIFGPGFKKEGELYVYPGDQPGSFLRKHPGHVIGGGIAFVASFAEALTSEDYPWRKWNKVIGVKDEWRKALQSCARQGLARSRGIMETGYLDPKDPTWTQNVSGRKGVLEHRHTILKEVGQANDAGVVRYEEPSGDWETACKIVYGDDSLFRQCILLSIGDLFTADPDYARALLDLERRLKRHSESGKGVLSFAIFGGPGSGKSFVAKALQKAIDPDSKIFELIERNLSQLGEDRQRLVDAFKEIVQVSLQGKTPFVLWDEFDCALKGDKCGWLSHFLMPMQDAKFDEGKEVRKLGTCVFVFMGGIHETADSFWRWINSDNPDEKKKAKVLKGPDFHSRLERSLQIPSVDVKQPYVPLPWIPIQPLTGLLSCLPLQCAKPPEPTTIEPHHIARLTRAILLRHYLSDDRFQHIKQVEEEVIAYLLHVPLKHGIRSLEKIIDASALDKTTIFRVSHLPFEDVLKLHTEQPDVKTFHKDLKGVSPGPGEPPDLLWRCYKPSGVERYERCFGLVERTLAREMAKEAHEKWCEAREKKKWNYGTVFSMKKKEDPRIVPYDQLSELEKESYEKKARAALKKNEEKKD
jgi:hypothetical protein